MLKFLRQQEIALPTVPILAATNVDSRLTDYLQQLHNTLTENSRLQQTKVEQFDYNTLVNEATPSVVSYYKHSYWVTGGTTTITNFAQGYHGQVITVIAEHSVTITHGTNIILNSGSSFSMSSGDAVTLIMKSDDKWYEVSRNVISAASLVAGGMYYSGEYTLTSGLYTTIPFAVVPSEFTDGIEDTVNHRINVSYGHWYYASVHCGFYVYEDNKELRLALRCIRGGGQKNAIMYHQPQHNNTPNAMWFSSSVSRVFYAEATSYIDAAVLAYFSSNATKIKGLGVDGALLTVHQLT